MESLLHTTQYKKLPLFDIYKKYNVSYYVMIRTSDTFFETLKMQKFSDVIER